MTEVQPKKSTRGGARPGAGRKLGVSKLHPEKYQARQERLVRESRVVLTAGLKPLEMMLYAMGFWANQVSKLQLRQRPDGTYSPEDLRMMQFAMERAELSAVRAAPYCHARYQTVTVPDEEAAFDDISKWNKDRVLQELRTRGITVTPMIEGKVISEKDG